MKKVTVSDRIKEISTLIESLSKSDQVDDEYQALVIYNLGNSFYVNGIAYSYKCAQEYGLFKNLSSDFYGASLFEALGNYIDFLEIKVALPCNDANDCNEEILCKNGKKYRLVEVK